MPNTSEAPKKKSMGRKKIDIEFINEINTRRQTFRKRVGGLFKKAHELHTLCGAVVELRVLFDEQEKQYCYNSREGLDIATLPSQLRMTISTALCAGGQSTMMLPPPTISSPQEVSSSNTSSFSDASREQDQEYWEQLLNMQSFDQQPTEGEGETMQHIEQFLLGN